MHTKYSSLTLLFLIVTVTTIIITCKNGNGVLKPLTYFGIDLNGKLIITYRALLLKHNLVSVSKLNLSDSKNVCFPNTNAIVTHYIRAPCGFIFL